VPRSEHYAGYWRVKLVLHYEGRNFSGFQIQRNQRTVQGELSSLLGELCGEPSARLTAAGRTDRGVHATGQVASALIPDRFEPPELLRALNALAPADLWIESAERVHIDFHPRFDATSRTYVYRVGVTPETRSPFMAPWCWPLGLPLDRQRLEAAAGFTLGESDFTAFLKAGQPERGTICRVREAAWRDSPWAGGILEFEITADRFLHRMVRYLVGVMVDIGRGRRPVAEMEAMLRQAEGLRPAVPAPPQGLFLTRVEYSKQSSDNGERTSGGANEDFR
jgi:tRNA pseudouridine38-40 synthase